LIRELISRRGFHDEPLCQAREPNLQLLPLTKIGAYPRLSGNVQAMSFGVVLVLIPTW